MNRIEKDRIERDIQEFVSPSWEIVARLSSDHYDDPSAILDRLARAIEQRFPGQATMKEADYPTHRLLVNTNQKLDVVKFADDWMYDQAVRRAIPGKKNSGKKARPGSSSKPHAGTRRAGTRILETRILGARPSHLTLPNGGVYELRPAASRTHYGQFREHGGGQPYAYATEKADGAWLVVSRWNHKTLGVLERGDDDWTFAKAKDSVVAPPWLRPLMHGATQYAIYPLSGRIHSAASPAEAVATGLASGF